MYFLLLLLVRLDWWGSNPHNTEATSPSSWNWVQLTQGWGCSCNCCLPLPLPFASPCSILFPLPPPTDPPPEEGTGSGSQGVGGVKGRGHTSGLGRVQWQWCTDSSFHYLLPVLLLPCWLRVSTGTNNLCYCHCPQLMLPQGSPRIARAPNCREQLCGEPGSARKSSRSMKIPPFLCLLQVSRRFLWVRGEGEAASRE